MTYQLALAYFHILCCGNIAISTTGVKTMMMATFGLYEAGYIAYIMPLFLQRFTNSTGIKYGHGHDYVDDNLQ